MLALARTIGVVGGIVFFFELVYVFCVIFTQYYVPSGDLIAMLLGGVCMGIGVIVEYLANDTRGKHDNA